MGWMRHLFGFPDRASRVHVPTSVRKIRFSRWIYRMFCSCGWKSRYLRSRYAAEQVWIYEHMDGDDGRGGRRWPDRLPHPPDPGAAKPVPEPEINMDQLEETVAQWATGTERK